MGKTNPEGILQHNGSAVIWPEKRPPFCYRGFHMQEILLLANRKGYILFPLEPRPVSNDYEIPGWQQHWQDAWSKYQTGIVIGATHAVARIGGIFWDLMEPKYAKSYCPIVIMEYWPCLKV